jgi:hypothetical protein
VYVCNEEKMMRSGYLEKKKTLAQRTEQNKTFTRSFHSTQLSHLFNIFALNGSCPMLQIASLR